MEWDNATRWRKQVEQRLNRLGSEVAGNAGNQADRITTIMGELDELRAELKTVIDRVDKIAKWCNSQREAR